MALVAGGTAGRDPSGDPDRQGIATLTATTSRLLALALPLNFAWELLQAPAFGSMGDTWLEGLLVCALATLGDGVIFVALFSAGILLFGRRWFAPPRLGRYVAIVAIAVVIQIAVEWAALATERWQYQPWHPTLFGAGLLPILQAVVLVPVVFTLRARWEAGCRRLIVP